MNLNEEINNLEKKQKKLIVETELKQKIETIMKEKKYETLEDIAPIINNLNTKLVIDFSKSLNLSLRDRLLFLLKIYECKSAKPDLKYILISLLMIDFINGNKKDFLNLLSDNEILDDFTDWFKNDRFLFYDLEDYKILEGILKIPKIQEEVLKDPSFYIRCNSFELFNSMPKECAASIAFYSRYALDSFETDLEKLYSKYFDDILNKKEQLYLIKEQIIEIKSYDIFELGLVKMLPFNNFLNRILKNRKYYDYAVNMQKNSNLDFNTILKFFYKYDEAPFFEKICKIENLYSQDTIRKIEYLSLENRLINSNQILDLDKLTLEDLKKLSKEKSDSRKLNVYGGPNGSLGKIFEDGFKREIRRIDRDGSIKIFDAANEDHEIAVKLAYPDIEFDSNCVMAIEKAIEAAKRLSAITFIIENEACYVVSSDDISEEQIEALSNLNVIDINISKFGIITYESDSNNFLIAYNGEDVTFDKMIEYMSLHVKNRTI